MSNEKKIEKKDWIANFTLIGKPVINDYTFKINEKSQNSNWIYNALNLGVDCGEAHGTVYAEMLGGYGEDRENVIYAHGKNEDGSDNFDEQIIVAWEDRDNESILEQIGELSLINVGLEKTNKGTTYYKKFLSEYDAIAYIQEHITDDIVVNVRGSLKYSEYNGITQVRKNITSIALSKADDPSKYAARFTQTVLIDRDSASLKTENVDVDKGIMFVDAIVLDYLKEKNGVEIRGQYPFKKRFEFPLDLTNQSQCKTILDKLFKVKKGYTQITFEGEFIEGGAVVTATLDDIPDDIKDLIAIGVYTEEDALARCSSNGNRERRMLLKKPYIKLVGEDKVPVVQMFAERFTEEDLIFDLGEEDDDIPFDADNVTSSSDAGNMDWLNQL